MRVLITGATGGMGQALATVFAKHGAQLGLHYRIRQAEAKQLLKKIYAEGTGARAELFRADLTRSADRKRLMSAFIKKFGGIDVLINNAGAIPDYVDFRKLKETSWHHTFDLNTMAPFYLCAEVFDTMKKQGGGKIINISSVNVKYGGSLKSMPYVASKAALESISKGLARAGAVDKILVNVIRPGLTDTGMKKRVPGYTEKDYQNRIALVPLKRAGKPEDIAKMAFFLAAETGDFITGEVFTVAGGD